MIAEGELNVRGLPTSDSQIAAQSASLPLKPPPTSNHIIPYNADLYNILIDDKTETQTPPGGMDGGIVGLAAIGSLPEPAVEPYPVHPRATSSAAGGRPPVPRPMDMNLDPGMP